MSPRPVFACPARRPSIAAHLLRGVGAAACLVLAFMVGDRGQTLAALGLVGAALVLMRGCPMCWLFGLVERIAQRSSETSDFSRK